MVGSYIPVYRYAGEVLVEDALVEAVPFDEAHRLPTQPMGGKAEPTDASEEVK